MRRAELSKLDEELKREKHDREMLEAEESLRRIRREELKTPVAKAIIRDAYLTYRLGRFLCHLGCRPHPHRFPPPPHAQPVQKDGETGPQGRGKKVGVLPLKPGLLYRGEAGGWLKLKVGRRCLTKTPRPPCRRTSTAWSFGPWTRCAVPCVFRLLGRLCVCICKAGRAWGPRLLCLPLVCARGLPVPYIGKPTNQPTTHPSNQDRPHLRAP